MSGKGYLQGFPQIPAPISGPDGRITQPWYQFMITLWGRTSASQGSTTGATSQIAPFASTNIPAGWLLCDGSAVSRTVYGALFGIIGTIWGAGDGSSTFNIPNLTNRFLVGNGTLTIGNATGSIPLTGGSGNGYGVIAWGIKT